MPSLCRFFLFVSLLVPACAWGGEEKPAQQPDPTAIASLVKQLGSRNFAEREKATKALEAIGVPALDALRAAAKGKDLEFTQRAARLVSIIENRLDQLLVVYRGYGLPLPPKDAKLVKIDSRSRYAVIQALPPTYSLGFLLRPGTKDKPPLLLVGTQQHLLDPPAKFEVIEPKLEVVQQIKPVWWRQATFDMNEGLAIALQCEARGWNRLAQELWMASIKQSSGHRFGAFFQPANLPYRMAVAYLAWCHYNNELVKPDTDRARIARQIKNLFAAEASLNSEGNRAILKSLEAALVPSRAKAATIERMIDDLTDMCNCNVGRGHFQTDPHTRLAHMGFAAIPALIQHLDDDRLTRSIRGGFKDWPPWQLRVKHVASNLLQELSDEEVEKDWEERQKGRVIEKADAQAWWEKARKIGEEAFFLAHYFPKEKLQYGNSLILEIIAAKYPRHLPKLYRTVLDERPYMNSSPVAEAVSMSSLPAEKKVELFLHAARNKDTEHRRLGFHYLQKLNPKEFMKLLLASLEALPKTPTEPYFGCPEAAYAHIVMATDDPRAWQMLEKVAKRSDVGLRMEFLGQMDTHEDYRKQRLKFLAAFLDDSEAPDVKANPKMFEGHYAGFMFDRLEVRNLAAMQIASILRMPDLPDKNWTPQQWGKLRQKVKEAVRR